MFVKSGVELVEGTFLGEAPKCACGKSLMNKISYPCNKGCGKQFCCAACVNVHECEIVAETHTETTAVSPGMRRWLGIF